MFFHTYVYHRHIVGCRKPKKAHVGLINFCFCFSIHADMMFNADDHKKLNFILNVYVLGL